MKRKKGFTLIELVVTMVIGCILMVSLTSILTLAQNGTYQTQRGTRATQAGEAIYEYIANQLKYAERVYIGDDASHKPADPDSWNAITVSAGRENGLLTVNGTQVYPLDYQEDCALTISAAGRARDQLDLTVTLADNRSSGVLYSKSSAITLSNLEGNGFGQTEGIVGAFLTADGFGSGTTIVETAAPVGKLVIYYKGGGSAIPVFNPDGGNQPQPTPGPSALSVLLPSRLDIEVGKTERLNSYVTLPTGAATVTYEWSFASNDKFSYTSAGSAGTNTTSYNLTGTKITEAENPVKVTLTVRCTVNGTEQSASSICLVTVWQTQSELMIKQGTSWDPNAPNLADQTIVVFTGSQVDLKAYALNNTGGGRPVFGTWKSNNPSVLSSQNSNKVEYKQTSHFSGVATLTFTADKWEGDYESNASIKGKQAKITVVVCAPGDMEFSLSFRSTGTSSSTIPFPGLGAIADYVECGVTLKAGLDEDYRAALKSALLAGTVQLVTGNEDNPWPSFSIIAQPLAAALHEPLGPSPACDLTCSIPLTIARKLYSDTESISGIGLTVMNSAGATIVSFYQSVPQANRLTITVGNANPSHMLYAQNGGYKTLPSELIVTNTSIQNGPNILLDEQHYPGIDQSQSFWLARKQGDTVWTRLTGNGTDQTFDGTLAYNRALSSPFALQLGKATPASIGTYELLFTFVFNGKTQTRGPFTIILQ